jgi:hypothetical protein
VYRPDGKIDRDLVEVGVAKFESKVAQGKAKPIAFACLGV